MARCGCLKHSSCKRLNKWHDKTMVLAVISWCALYISSSLFQHNIMCIRSNFVSCVSEYRIERMFGGGKLWRISHQKLLASKSLANLSSFAFLIVHTIDNLDYRRANLNSCLVTLERHLRWRCHHEACSHLRGTHSLIASPMFLLTEDLENASNNIVLSRSYTMFRCPLPYLKPPRRCQTKYGPLRPEACFSITGLT